MRYAIEPLRKEGVRIMYYLDDICILAKKKREQMAISTRKIRTHLEKLGFIINYTESALISSKKQEFLGFQFDSKNMTISARDVKISNLIKRIRQLVKQPKKSCHWIAELLGKTTSMIPAIGEALLHIRYLQRDLFRTL